jgi:hypothetical protein
VSSIRGCLAGICLALNNLLLEVFLDGEPTTLVDEAETILEEGILK